MADAADLKSADRKVMRVRLPLRAPLLRYLIMYILLLQQPQQISAMIAILDGAVVIHF